MCARRWKSSCSAAARAVRYAPTRPCHPELPRGLIFGILSRARSWARDSAPPPQSLDVLLHQLALFARAPASPRIPHARRRSARRCHSLSRPARPPSPHRAGGSRRQAHSWSISRPASRRDRDAGSGSFSAFSFSSRIRTRAAPCRRAERRGQLLLSLVRASHTTRRRSHARRGLELGFQVCVRARRRALRASGLKRLLELARWRRRPS